MKTTEPGPRDGPSDGPSDGPAVGSRPPGAKPSRRKVLTVAVTAAAGVAASRLLGLRDLDQRALAASRAADSMAMGVMGDETVEP